MSSAKASRPGGRRRSLVEVAYLSIKEKVLDNTFGSGEQFLEADLSQRLKMSRTPIREALIRLQAEGLVELTPRHGMRVLPVSPTDMEQIYQVLTALEAEAAELAAVRRPSKADLAPIVAACDAMEAALLTDDLVAWATADESFHEGLLDLSGNSRLIATCTNFWEQTHRVRMITLQFRPKPVSSTRDHRKLIGAIRKGDGIRAREIHRAHRKAGGKVLIDLLRRLNPKAL